MRHWMLILFSVLLLGCIVPAAPASAFPTKQIYTMTGSSTVVGTTELGDIWAVSDSAIGTLFDGVFQTFPVAVTGDAPTSMVFAPSTHEFLISYLSGSIRAFQVVTHQWRTIGKVGSSAGKIQIDSFGHLYVFSSGHLYQYAGSTWTDLAPTIGVIDFDIAPNGVIWLATYHGVYNNASGTFQNVVLASQKIDTLAVDPDTGDVWFADSNQYGSNAQLFKMVGTTYTNQGANINATWPVSQIMIRNGHIYYNANGSMISRNAINNQWDALASQVPLRGWVIDTNGQLWAGSYSGVLEIKLPPDAPDLNASTITSTSVSLYWPTPNRAETYDLYQDGKLIGSATNTNSPTVYNLTPNTTYHFTATSRNAEGISLTSAPLVVTTAPPTPTGLTTSNGTSTSVTLTWKPSAGATHYSVYQNGNWVTDVPGSSYTVTGLTAGNISTFSVSSKNSTTESDRSPEVTYMSPAAPPPVATLSINGGAAQTSTSSVSLSVTAASPAYPASDLSVSFSADGLSWSSKQNYQTTPYPWTLPSQASGDYPVFVRVADPSGNTTIAYASIFETNPTRPNVGGTPTQGGVIGGGLTAIQYDGISNVYVLKSNQVTLDLSASGAPFASVSSDNINFSDLFPTSSGHPISLPAGDGLKTVYVRLATAQDTRTLGDVGQVYFLVDSTSPTFSLTGFKGATATSGTSYTVQIDAEDNTTPYAAMQYQIDASGWHTLPADGRITISGFPAHSGPQTFSITLKDYAGNQTTHSISFWSI